jgi:hypothetical protein
MSQIIFYIIIGGVKLVSNFFSRELPIDSSSTLVLLLFLASNLMFEFLSITQTSIGTLSAQNINLYLGHLHILACHETLVP